MKVNALTKEVTLTEVEYRSLALTAEDIEKIEDLCMEVTTLFATVGRNKDILEQPFYEEIARRFNKQRNGGKH